MAQAGQDNLYRKTQLAEGSELTTFGVTGIAHNRNMPAAAPTTHPGTDATNTEKFTLTENVLQITLLGKLNAVSNHVHKCRVCINAPTATIAKAWLEDDGALGQDVQYETFNVDTPHTMNRDTAITCVDVLPVGGVAVAVSIAGVGVPR